MAKCFNFASKADKRIEVYTLNEVEDGSGGFDTNYVLQGSYWSYIEPLSSFEVFQSEQLKSKVTDKFVIRYNADFKNTRVTATYIIKFDDRYYDIKGIRNLADDMKAEGYVYQSIKAVENDSLYGENLNITFWEDLIVNWENINDNWETI